MENWHQVLAKFPDLGHCLPSLGLTGEAGSLTLVGCKILSSNPVCKSYRQKFFTL